MNKQQYLKNLQEAYDSGKIDNEAYDAAYCMAGLFCDEDGTDEEPYISSASGGDYSPSCPWGAPGMSIRDFI